jgi:flavorubredoxin
MKPVEILKNVYDVGVNDWNIRDFHGYSTWYGTSYNAFLILDEKNVLIDTVKDEYTDQMIDNIAAVIDPCKIDYVVSNHTELDHSGGLPRIMHRIGEDKPIFCSKLGAKNLSKHFRTQLNYQVVDESEPLNLGNRTLSFLETRMVHWPDSMFSYLSPDKVLFSSDGFGQHYAGFEKFDDVVGDDIMFHAKKYYANILLLYAPLLLKLVKKVKEIGLEIDMICPDHGIIWRKDPMKIIDAYVRWSKQELTNKAVVLYDTMWHSTEKMADAIASGIAAQGVSVRPMHLRKWHRSDVMTEILDAGAVVVGSPTLNNGIFPTVADFLTYMKGLKPKNRIGAAFGSYGWSGEGGREVADALTAMKFNLMDPSIKYQFVPGPEGLEACHRFGRDIGEAVMVKTKTA